MPEISGKYWIGRGGKRFARPNGKINVDAYTWPISLCSLIPIEASKKTDRR